MTTQLEDVLERFRDKTADEIAEMIKRRHIKGRLGTTSKCPLAVMLDNVGTGRYIIGRKYIVRQVSADKFEKASTPRQVAKFIRQFDLGKYPHLIAPPPRCLGPVKRKVKPRLGQKNPSGRRRGATKHYIAKLVSRFDKTAAQPA